MIGITLFLQISIASTRETIANSIN